GLRYVVLVLPATSAWADAIGAVAVLDRQFGCLNHQFGYSDTLAEQVLGPRHLFQTSKFAASLAGKKHKCACVVQSLASPTSNGHAVISTLVKAVLLTIVVNESVNSVILETCPTARFCRPVDCA